jgi:RimJ/RimL family protein N-acetyltransferase
VSQLEPVTLSGQCARLVPLELSHAPGLLAASHDPAIWAFMPAAPPETLTDIERMIADALTEQTQGNSVPFTIMDQETQSIVGSTRFLDISQAHRQAEIGWTWLTPAVWRTRINTECKYLLLRHAFETGHLLRVQLKMDARNERSQRAIERIGGVREGILRRHRILHDGFVRDSVYYSVISEEWPAVKARLERLLADRLDRCAL